MDYFSLEKILVLISQLWGKIQNLESQLEVASGNVSFYKVAAQSAREEVTQLKKLLNEAPKATEFPMIQFIKLIRTLNPALGLKEARDLAVELRDNNLDVFTFSNKYYSKLADAGLKEKHYILEALVKKNAEDVLKRVEEERRVVRMV